MRSKLNKTADAVLFNLGRMMGIEPTASGTTTRRSNQLSYIRRTSRIGLLFCVILRSNKANCSIIYRGRLDILYGFDIGTKCI